MYKRCDVCVCVCVSVCVCVCVRVFVGEISFYRRQITDAHIGT